MKISLIIPAFNEEKLIARSLDRIRSAAAEFVAHEWFWEWIVCDNNSTDRTASLARTAGATVVFEPVNQIARARNTGARAASGDWLVFIDADSEPSRGLFADVAERIAAGRHVGGGSCVRLDRNTWSVRIGNVVWNGLSRACRWAAGSFIFCHSEAFKALGGFNEDYYCAEEIEFSRRLKRYGREHGLRFEILTDHPLVTSSRKLDLYSRAQVLRLVFNGVFRHRRTALSREACSLWYDGRR